MQQALADEKVGAPKMIKNKIADMRPMIEQPLYPHLIEETKGICESLFGKQKMQDIFAVKA